MGAKNADQKEILQKDKTQIEAEKPEDEEQEPQPIIRFVKRGDSSENKKTEE